MLKIQHVLYSNKKSLDFSAFLVSTATPRLSQSPFLASLTSGSTCGKSRQRHLAMYLVLWLMRVNFLVFKWFTDYVSNACL